MGAIVCKVWRVLMHPRVYLTVEPVLLVFMFGQFLSYPIFQQLVRHMICARTPNCTTDTSGNHTPCNKFDYQPDAIHDQVQTQTSHWILYVNLAYGVPSIVFSLLYGSISDQLGRKLFIFLPALGAALNTALILEVAYIDQLPLYMFLIGAATSGLYGSYSVLNSAAYAYASDLTAHSGRTRQIGLLESMTYLGATLSSLVGGDWVRKAKSFIPPFWCVLSCHLAVMVYTVFALPESMQFSRQPGERPSESTYHLRYSQSNKVTTACGRFLSALKHNLFGFFKLLFTNWRVSFLLLTFFTVEINFLGITDVVILYTFASPLCWNSRTVGYFLAFKEFMNGIGSLFVLPFLLFLNFNDALIILIGLVSGAASLIVMGVATKTWIMFIVPVVATLRGCVVPCIRSMLSKQVPSDKQARQAGTERRNALAGILFSSIGIVEAVCTLLASVIYNTVYPATRKVNPGTCFFIMAASLALPFCLVMILFLTRKSYACCCCYYGRRRGKELKRRVIAQIESEPLLQ